MKSLLSSVVVFVISAQVHASVAVPKINLDFWNKDTSILWNNNCYNYSTNRVTNSFAQPGEASGEIYVDITCKDVLEAAGKDLGLTEVKSFKFKDKNDSTLIALVVAPGYDFHWYRRDDNNMWSHKPGSTEATSKDQNDDLISDPETADRGYYTDFCGYFRITNNISDADEQDEGYVRIGDMMELPDILEETKHVTGEISDVEALIYSGRKNPTVSLQSLLNARISSELQHLVQRLNVEAPGVMSTNMPSRLGYNGFLIHDRQGLLFAKGTSVHVKGNIITAYSQGRHVALYDKAAALLEKELNTHFSVSRK